MLLVGSGTLNVTRSAFTNNHAHAFSTGAIRGGAIFSDSSTVNVSQSVFAGNSAPTAGGAIHVGGSTLTVATSVFAQNSAASNPNLSGSSIVSNGNNRSDQGNGLTHGTDVTGTVDYVVTSVRDSFQHYDDARALSVREAIDLANTNDGSLEEIWLPAWNFVLTRAREKDAGFSDVDVAFGDLDVTDSLKVRGIAGLTSVTWRLGVIDTIFDLVGDYNGNGIASGTTDDGGVGSLDFLFWQQQYGQNNGIGSGQSSADGDDDGDVDSSDNTIRLAHLGNTLELFDLAVVMV